MYENFSLASVCMNLEGVVLSEAIQAHIDKHSSVKAENVDFIEEENRILSPVPEKGVRRLILEVRKKKRKKGAIEYKDNF